MTTRTADQGVDVHAALAAPGRSAEIPGRRVGADIVQVGTHSDGTPIRWTFTEVTPDSFRWTGEALPPDGRTWKLEGEFRGRRMASPSGTR
jgi:hypothetical protein